MLSGTEGEMTNLEECKKEKRGNGERMDEG